LSNKTIISVSIIILFIFGVFNQTNLLQAEEYPPTLSVIAPYNSSIVIDGSYNEWNNASQGNIDLFPMEPHDPPIMVTATINFAYDDNYLYGSVYIPNDQGPVYAIELMFFGREDQGQTLDSVFLNASDNFYDDHAFDSFYVEPQSDVSRGGVNNVYAFSQMKPYGSCFEFRKDLRSGDFDGYDFNLAYGESIGVFIIAWIDTTTPGGPNWSIMDASYFKYIRLSIDVDNGDYIKVPEMGAKINWVLAEEIYEAIYVSDLTINYDGQPDEDFWSRAISYHVTLCYMNWSENYIDQSNCFDGNIRFVTDGHTLYVYFEIYDEVFDEGDETIFILGEEEDMLEIEEGTDLVVMEPNFYEDMLLVGNQGEPVPDSEFGGTIDGQAVVVYEENRRQIEFSKPLNSGDFNGADLNAQVGDIIYFATLAQYQSFEGPNFIDGTYDNESMPALIIHPLRLLTEGEEPTGSNTPNNTFTLGFSSMDLLFAFGLLTIVAVYTKLRIKRTKK